MSGKPSRGKRSGERDDGSVGHLSSDDEEDEEEDNFRANNSDEEGEVDDDGMTVLPDGSRKKREPKLRAKISTKHIKTMEQIEEIENKVRYFFFFVVYCLYIRAHMCVCVSFSLSY